MSYGGSVMLPLFSGWLGVLCTCGRFLSSLLLFSLSYSSLAFSSDTFCSFAAKFFSSYGESHNAGLILATKMSPVRCRRAIISKNIRYSDFFMF
jgi:hypothetical protein